MRPVNLLPDQHRPHQAGGQSGSAYFVVGLLAVLLALVVGYVITSNSVSGRESKAASAKGEADRLEQRAQHLAPFGDFAKVKETRLASVRELAQGRFDWERFMREISLILPTGSWLRSADSSITGDVGGATAQPVAAAPADGEGGAPKANLQGCTRRQSEVAKMMLRVREMHRVSDVELNESKRDDQSSEASADSCGRLYAFDLTVTFEPAQPSDETPAGVKRVPASLGGGS